MPSEPPARRLGPERVLGISVGDVDEACAATLAGADYLGVTVWSTPTKPEAEAVGIDGLCAVRRDRRCPSWGSAASTPSNAARYSRPAPLGSP